METITYLFQQFSFLELLAYALMYGIAIALAIGIPVRLYRYIREIINEKP